MLVMIPVAKENEIPEIRRFDRPIYEFQKADGSAVPRFQKEQTQ